MTPLETALTGITATLVSGIVFFIIKDVFWSKALKNQDKIDTDIVKSVETDGDKIIELEKFAEKYTFIVANLVKDIEAQKAELYKSKDGVQQLVKVLETVNENMKAQHNDIRVQNAEIKKVMDTSNILLQETTNINRELLGYLKGIIKQ